MSAKARRGRKRNSKAIVGKEGVLVAIRATARKNGTNKLSMREIDREIRAYRIERSQVISKSRS